MRTRIPSAISPGACVSCRARAAEAGEGHGQGVPSAFHRACSHLSTLSRVPAGLPGSGALAPLVGAWLLAWGATVLLSCAAVSHSGKDTNCSEIILIQEIVKDGFHRDLLIRVKLGTNIENSQTCNVLIKYHLPMGLYVDPYELASLQEHNVTEAMIIQDTVDLEAPDYLSEEFDVLLYAKSDSQCSECFRTILPIHCRYHQPEEKEERAFVVVKNPELFVSCYNDFPSLNCWKQSEMEAPCSMRNKHICQWSNMKYKSVNQNVMLQVPVGLRVHCHLVCVMTLFITVLCSGLILRAVFKHGHFSL
ncbi:GPI alpha-1,4-mannosyltransferase I, stabilizing subunit isoform X1 [Phascolarctos cinereus]|uniref:Phosphatidylinositol-glycan biosynthesis class X protein n=1 Tax=Phascolarctos cinereus TaxID=38626 RepID=A0A6P5K9P2_PHACI|nr:phosphatidylinositol-glycan biosynthesis class X protein isoform X1 [Phascolarctos cinereus]